MCGILALIKTPWNDCARDALGTLSNRGPNDQTILDLGDAFLGHTRLAIIDIERGSQPMRCQDGRYAIVFNGEIYNFKELRDELKDLGYVFKTNSDTEVLLVGWKAWNEHLLQKLDGMYSFSIWDSLEQTLFAARDLMGIKPLFYSTTSGLVVASTLAPFFKLKGFPKELDFEAMRDFLASQVCYAPHSFLSHVKQLPPASWLKYDAKAGSHKIGSYWKIETPKPFNEDRETLLERVDLALKESVRRQLVADVPLGAFLSGGIDSSLMVRYIVEAGISSLKTFSFKFQDKAFDETVYAKAVAEQFGCDHYVIEAPVIDGASFKKTIIELDQPLADPSYVMTHALSGLARSHVTVAIGGDGGDELFGGYPRFLDTEALNPKRFGQPLLKKCVEAGILPQALLRRSLYGQELLLYRRTELGPWKKSRKSLMHYFKPEVEALLNPGSTLKKWKDLVNDLSGTMDSATLMRADLWTYLSENCLAKSDRASMAHGLELRVPILGKPVLDTVLSLPSSVHFEKGPKALLTELARRSLPRSVWDRPKHGFSVPLQHLFQGPWKQVCEEALAEIDTLAPFLNKEAVMVLWNSALEGRGSRRLAYSFIVLLLWLSHHKI